MNETIRQIRIPLYQVPVGNQFIYKGRLYTVTEHALGMTEVISQDKFWAWPDYDGKKTVKVNQIIN